MECPECVSGTFVWKYNIKEHWAHAHSSEEIPPIFLVSEKEHSAVVTQGKLAASSARHACVQQLCIHIRVSLFLNAT